MKASWFANHIGQVPALIALRNFPCVPSNCPIKTMEKFMEDISNIGDLVDTGKITNGALEQMKKVFSSLGHVNSTNDKVNLNMARGAVGVITSLKRITDKTVIDGFEVAGEVRGATGKVIGKRIMDVKTTDGTLIEVKGWTDKVKSLEYLLGKLDDEGGLVAGKISAQLLKDIVSKTLNKNEKRIWIFADESMEALKPQFAAEIIKKIQTDSALQRNLAKNIDPRISELSQFRAQYLKDIETSVNALIGSF